MAVVALATYSHGCDERSPSLKTLISFYCEDVFKASHLLGCFLIDKCVKKEKRIKQHFEGNIESVS